MAKLVSKNFAKTKWCGRLHPLHSCHADLDYFLCCISELLDLFVQFKFQCASGVKTFFEICHDKSFQTGGISLEENIMYTIL